MPPATAPALAPRRLGSAGEHRPLDGYGVLSDLRDLAARKDGSDFRRRLEALRAEHARKPTLIERLQKVGL
jgi:hypothetical protein